MVVSEAAANKEIPAYRYTIELMNDKLGEVIQTVPKNELPLQQNAPVLVKQYDDHTKFIFLDRTQGLIFDRAKSTSFKE